MNTRPSGAANIMGYNGTLREAVVSGRQVPFCQTSGMRLFTPAVSPPETVRTSPLASVVLVGYQRPFCMSGPRVQPRSVVDVCRSGAEHVHSDVPAGDEQAAIGKQGMTAAKEVAPGGLVL